jgi:RNA polymerase sigma-70 factor, ECF subfamily
LNSSSVSTKLLVLSLTGTKPEDSKSKECGGDFATYSDEMLLSSVQAGEQEALGCLFRRYARIALGIGKRILCDEAEAEDLVQDVFLYIHRKSGLYNPAKGRASSWIIQTVYYQALQRRMRLTAGGAYSTHEVQGGSDAMLIASSTVECDHSAEVIFGRSTWQGILKTLTEDQWETLRMHFFEGYTLGEIAEKRGQPVGNTRHHFYRGLEALRKQVFATDLSRREKNKVKCSLNVVAEDR